MSAHTTIATWMAALGDALGRPRGPRARRALREIADHLDDAAAALESGGATRIEAERLACERFGTVEGTARALAAGGVLAGEIPGWIALPLWGGLALSVMAGLVFVAMAFIDVAPIRGPIEIGVLLVTLATAYLFGRLQLSSAAAGRAERAAGGLSGLLLVGGIGLGVAALVFGTLSGDMEYYLFVRAALIAGTGGVGLVALTQGRWRATGTR
jgi:hypothetical protein